MQKTVPTRGGRRQGSGRSSLFRGKSSKAEKPLFKKIPPPTHLLLTPEAFTLMTQRCSRLSKEYAQHVGNPTARISRNELLEGLLRVYGKKLTLQQLLKAATS